MAVALCLATSALTEPQKFKFKLASFDYGIHIASDVFGVEVSVFG